MDNVLEEFKMLTNSLIVWRGCIYSYLILTGPLQYNFTHSNIPNKFCYLSEVDD